MSNNRTIAAVWDQKIIAIAGFETGNTGCCLFVFLKIKLERTLKMFLCTVLEIPLQRPLKTFIHVLDGTYTQRKKSERIIQI